MIMLILLVANGLLLVLVNGIIPKRAVYSAFELKRLENSNNQEIIRDAQRQDAYSSILSLQRISSSLLLIMFVAIAIALLGWLIGLLVAGLFALQYGALTRIPLVHTYAQSLYDRYELQFLKWVSERNATFWWVRSLSVPDTERKLGSKDELLDMVTSAHILTKNEELLLRHGLAFSQKIVRDTMTPRSMLDSIKRSEILGPLVLDGLHRTGHSRFPVVGDSIDDIVGILHLRDVLTIDTRKRHTSKVESAMEQRVFYIQETATLSHALSAFLSSHRHLFIVINGFRETVGVLTLEDTIEVLLGRKIVDEFDSHDDIRRVALRAPVANESAKLSTNV